MQDAWEAGANARVRITQGVVSRRIEAMRRGAQPGGSKTRCDFLACILHAPGGAATLVEWCQRWADGQVPPAVTEPLVEQVLRPLRKPNGTPRNIAFLENLFKLASGALQEELRSAGG